MIGLLTIGLIGLALCKKRSVSGIGAAYKRRVYREIERLQPYVDFDLSYDDQTDKAKKYIDEDSDFVNKQFPKREPITPERYYKQLRRAYRAISGIGATNLPYKTYTVRNNRGDIILQHRDYGTPEQMFQDAIDYLLQTRALDYYDLGKWEAITAIATGKKFVWASKGVHRGVEEVAFGATSPMERKARISYLASPQKGGVYPEVFAESIVGNSDYAHEYVDDQELLNGVIDALREVSSVKQAKEMILNKYINENTIPDSETPF